MKFKSIFLFSYPTHVKIFEKVPIKCVKILIFFFIYCFDNLLQIFIIQNNFKGDAFEVYPQT